MNPYLLPLAILLTGWLSQPDPPVAGPESFVASSPCDDLPRSLLGIPARADCEFITWRLVLNRDAQTARPTTFGLGYRYGLSLPGTQGFQNGGTAGQLTGTWRIQTDTNRRTLYLLTPESGAPLRFLKLQDDLLHLLDADGHLMVGHAAWSYTLNRN